MRQARGTGRQRPGPRVRGALALAVLAGAGTLAAAPLAPPAPAPDTALRPPAATRPAPAMPDSPVCRLDWQSRRDADRLEVSPVITCDRPCRLRFLLATAGSPSGALRQSGSLHLAADTPRLLGRMILAGTAPACRVQLTLWHEDGREERFETDTCTVPPLA